MRGDTWERLLAHQHTAYRAERRAVVWQTHPRRDGRGRHLDKAPPDFVGVLGDGRSVLFDAKCTASARFSFAKLADHQARDLEAHHDRGGLSMVVLRIGDRAFAVPWEWLRLLWWEWREKRGSGRPLASVGVEWLEEMAPEMTGADWLGALMREGWIG